MIKEAKWKTEMLRHRGKEQRTHTQNKKQQQQSTSGAPIKQCAEWALPAY